MVKEAVIQWLHMEKAITLTLDVGTMSGLVMLTALLVSDTSGKTKLGGFKLITCKDGDVLADTLVSILTENLGKSSIVMQLLSHSHCPIIGN